MGGKRKTNENEGMEGEEDSKHNIKKMKKEKSEILPSSIKNKEKRSAVHAKLKHQKKLDKRKKLKARDATAKRALELGEEPPPKQIPRTIENTREADETVCMPDDEELFAGNDADEFSAVLKQDRTPKILITTCRFNSTRGPAFITELLSVIPNSHYYKRGTYDLKKIVEYANNKEFTSIIVVHTNRREPDALLIIGLPDGPTAHFKLSSLVLRKDIKNHGNPTSHEPELVLNNFTTRLGHRIGRLHTVLFYSNIRVLALHTPCALDNTVKYVPSLSNLIFSLVRLFGLRVSDFVVDLYIFESKEIKQSESKGKKAKDTKGESISKEKVIARLQECGPRFTLKLVSLQHGTFDTRGGEFEWVHKPEMDTSRRRFFL
ncbi:ribosome production factor 1-like [Gossypium australe]|uniref:Ribosome production factor 1-like n=1 Tax=Gossypium australe TaxID=47621 RepID=A0A5B6UL73_9ROSI|nr:ribosome production factor 1-like [Gossypium australe]